MIQTEHHLLAVNGIHLSLYRAGPESGPPVWLLHGFPECWFAWRHTVDALAAAGYRVCVPEMRGYGRSSAPPASKPMTCRPWATTSSAPWTPSASRARR